MKCFPMLDRPAMCTIMQKMDEEGLHLWDIIVGFSKDRERYSWCRNIASKDLNLMRFLVGGGC